MSDDKRVELREKLIAYSNYNRCELTPDDARRIVLELDLARAPLSDECMGLMGEMYEAVKSESEASCYETRCYARDVLLPIMDKLNAKLHFKEKT